jgi:hypothetical protein
MATVQRAPGSVEAMRNVLSYLVEERHRLRGQGADAVELDANLKAIVAIRSRLTHALVESRSLPERPADTC